MNLRVRSVTGCSRSAMFASCVVQLMEVLDIVNMNAATYRECATGSFNGRMKSSWSCVGILRVWSLSFMLASFSLGHHILASTAMNLLHST